MPTWYEGQDATSGYPDHYTPRDAAEQLKATGEARPIHGGKGLLILKSKPMREEKKTFSSGTAWRVVGQTARPNVFHKPSQFGPGMPHYQYT